MLLLDPGAYSGDAVTDTTQGSGDSAELGVQIVT